MAAKTWHKIWVVKIQHFPISSKFDMWVDKKEKNNNDNKKQSKNNKSPKRCLGDLIINNSYMNTSYKIPKLNKEIKC
jgi:hypothetical protein